MPGVNRQRSGLNTSDMMLFAELNSSNDKQEDKTANCQLLGLAVYQWCFEKDMLSLEMCVRFSAVRTQRACVVFDFMQFDICQTNICQIVSD